MRIDPPGKRWSRFPCGCRPTSSPTRCASARGRAIPYEFNGSVGVVAPVVGVVRIPFSKTGRSTHGHPPPERDPLQLTGHGGSARRARRAGSPSPAAPSASRVSPVALPRCGGAPPKGRQQDPVNPRSFSNTSSPAPDSRPSASAVATAPRPPPLPGDVHQDRVRFILARPLRGDQPPGSLRV